jgi:hypothetical protein
LPWQDTGEILSADNTMCFVHTVNFVSEMAIQTDGGLASNMHHHVSQRQLNGTDLICTSKCHCKVVVLCNIQREANQCPCHPQTLVICHDKDFLQNHTEAVYTNYIHNTS